MTTRTTKRRSRRSRPGFTILELLVVIAIIGLVMALSIPAMSKALGVAAESNCTSNLRSLGQATAAYTVDFKRKFPAGLGNTLNVLNLVGDRGIGNHSGNIPAEDRLLNGYIDHAYDTAVCPLDRGEERYDAATTADFWGTSYSIVNNDYDNSFGTRAYAYRFARNGLWSLEGFGILDVTSPATKAVLTDFIQMRNLDANERHAWHGLQDGHLRSGMAFADGHAETLRLKVLPSTLTQRIDYRTYGQIEKMAKEDLYY